MKRLTAIAVGFAAIVCAAFGLAPKFSASAETAAAKSGMIVIERTTNRVLLCENENTPLPMASLTKIMTAIVAIEHCDDLNARHKIPKEAVGVEGSSIYLVEGEELSVRELLYGLMLRSGNDAAEALAILTAGTVENFVGLMNDKAAELGLENTKFQNPHGLPAKEHYTSCYDLAMISSYAMKNELFRQIVGTKSIKISNTTKDYDRVLKNKNKMLWEYEGGCGIKTGYTKEAGRCLVSAAERGDMKLICVVLNCGPMWEVSKEKMEECFNRYEFRNILCAGQLEKSIAVTGGLAERAGVYLKEDITLLVEKDAELEVEFDLPESLPAPLVRDQEVGEVRIFCEKELLFSQKIYNIEGIEVQTQKIFEKIFGNWSLLCG